MIANKTIVGLSQVDCTDESLRFRRPRRRSERERARVATSPRQRLDWRPVMLVTHLMMPVVGSLSCTSPSGAVMSKVAKIWTIARNMQVSARYKPEPHNKR